MRKNTGKTITRKILEAHSRRKDIVPGDIVSVDVDGVFSHDVFSPFVIDEFKRYQTKTVWDNKKVYFIVDHEIPASTEEAGLCYRKMVEFSRKQNITMHMGDGVCHQLIPESGYVLPGQIFLGTDSHTVTYGALGAFSTGIGTTEMAHVWATGQIWLRVPEEIKVRVKGVLKDGVSAKDVILFVISKIKSDGATYKTLEFCGDTIKNFSMSERLTICNMGVEMGAKNAIIAPDEKSIEFLRERSALFYNLYNSDQDATYSQIIEVNASEIERMVWFPEGIDNIIPVNEAGSIEVDQVFIGSCTNGRFEDFEIVAKVLKDKKVKRGVRLIITPASRKIYERLIDVGILKTFSQAGAIITNPYCGFCMGKNGGRLSRGDVCVATNNRNFIGRLGHPESKVFLASPLTAVIAAIEGRIIDPRKFLE
jgi:3-isopropylmalate/(R)-2-methylmalate dehydratase large subunit